VKGKGGTEMGGGKEGRERKGKDGEEERREGGRERR